MTIILEKVTAFVTRPTPGGEELLLFRHPNAGIQIPAGTVEPGESIQAAALREATEETGLTGLAGQTYLGDADDPPPAGHVIVGLRTPVYTHPDYISWTWAQLGRSSPVKVNRKQNGFSQVTYEEWDRLPDPQYVTLHITGWVPDEVLTESRRRHFYHFEFHGQSPATWMVHIDDHNFKLFWAPLTALPAIIYPQNEWIRFLAQKFPQIQFANGGATA
jgi:8-oxo-dGTP pyrophosphatase MutT (NUDIX family)